MTRNARIDERLQLYADDEHSHNPLGPQVTSLKQDESMADRVDESAKLTEAFDAVTRWCNDYFLSATGSGTPLGPQFVRVVRAFGEIAAANADSQDVNRALRLSMLREKAEAYLQGFMRGDLAGESSGTLPEPSRLVQAEAQVHVQERGDTPWLSQLAECGAAGTGRRLEGFALRVNPPIDGVALRYKAHLAVKGDTLWIDQGEYCGTRGQNRRVEAIWIELAEGADRFDVYYSAHLCRFGWTGWFKNGQMCGTRGEYRQVEAIKVFLAEKSRPVTP